ncbi:MAG: dihydrolipoyl dehydrogenase [Desulfurococcales archaeon]|nr:dihydrolipoyl dehydrogenase [Desulfurococcales archaeon]
MPERFDLLVIGGGPGGYPAAVRASQLGLNVALVEADSLGGECTNYGCIPTKAMLHPVLSALTLKRLGVNVEVPFESVARFAEEVVSRVRGGVETLLRGYGVEVIKGRARVKERRLVEVDGYGEVRYDKLVVATGTSPATLPGMEPDGDVVLDNRGAVRLRKKPGSMLVIGGGYVGVEFATVMASLGVEVHLVEIMDRLLPGMDRDLARIAERHLKALGVKVYTSSRVGELERRESHAKATIETPKGRVEVEAEKVLVAVGRRPNTRGLGLERLGVELDSKGYVKVNQGMETTAPGVYASGDVAGPPLLAHKAFAQAVVAAERAAGDSSAAYDPRAVPSVVYTEPELASAGMTKEEAERRGFEAAEKRYPLASLARVYMEGCRDCFIKVVYDRGSGAVLGVHVAAPHASEIIAEAVLAMEMGAALEDLALTIHPHPTVSEALREAAEFILEKPIHYVLRRR